MNAVRVLLAEDSPVVAGQLRALLAQCFDVVAVVVDGAELCDAIDAIRPDVLVTDISLPHIDGLAVAALARQRHPDLRIVFITVHSDADLVARAHALPNTAYVLKTEAGDALVPAVHAVLAGTWFLSPSLARKAMPAQ